MQRILELKRETYLVYLLFNYLSPSIWEWRKFKITKDEFIIEIICVKIACFIYQFNLHIFFYVKQK